MKYEKKQIQVLYKKLYMTNAYLQNGDFIMKLLKRGLK